MDFRVDMPELQNIPNINDWGKHDVQGYCTTTFQLSGSRQDQYLKGHLDIQGEDDNTKKRGVNKSEHSANKTLSVADTAGQRKKPVISTYEVQSTQKLCDSTKSRGPEFASLGEGKYCNTPGKTGYNLCSSRYSRDCFLLAREGGRLRRRCGSLDTNDAVRRELERLTDKNRLEKARKIGCFSLLRSVCAVIKSLGSFCRSQLFIE